MLCFVFAALVVLLDQFFKHWIVRAVELEGEMGLIPGVIDLTHIRNPGAAFGLLKTYPWLLAVISFVAAIVIIFILLRYTDGFWGTLGLSAVLGGTVGNLIDRVFNGYVVDMFRPLFIRFAIFNIADIFLTLGFITFCIHFILTTLKAQRGNVGLAEAEAEDDEDFEELEQEDPYSIYDVPDAREIPDFVDLSDTKVVPILKGKPAPAEQPAQFENAQDDLDYYQPEDFDAVFDEQNFCPPETFEAAFEEQNFYEPEALGSVLEQQNYYQPETLDAALGEQDYYQPETLGAALGEQDYFWTQSDPPQDIPATLDALETLESELDSIDDYDTDEILRKYGFE